MRIGFLLSVMLLLFTSGGSAQKNDSLRTQYVERFPDYFFVWPVVKQRSTSIDVRQNGNGKTLTFKPNNSYGAGFGVYLFEVGAEITFSVPVKEEKNEIYGKSDALDLQLNLLGKNWGADIFYSNYGGFYTTDSDKPVPPNTPYPQRPDLSTINFGLNGIYAFNKNKFSLRSAYNFAERQKKSAGSFLLAGSISSYHLKADSALYGKYYEPVFGKDADVSDFRSFTISAAPGYTYTLVAKNVFLNAALSIGPAYRNIEYMAGGTSHSSAGVNGYVDFRAGLGYNGKRFFGGLNFVSQARSVNFESAQITVTSSTFRLLVGYRFLEFGILKARALDLLPHKGNNN
jgi:hypothetical protein